MRLNEKEAVSNPRILLVPYHRHHVPSYHKWMEDDALREATASERLTLDEEYAMQESWRQDRDKLTFISCLPFLLPLEDGSSTAGDPDSQSRMTRCDFPDRMIGDVNLFLYPAENEDGNGNDDDDSGSSEAVKRRNSTTVVGEISLMIARNDLHNRGYGRAALMAFMEYVLTRWTSLAQEFCLGDEGAQISSDPQLAYLSARIGEGNERSIRLFSSVGFVKTSEKPNYFGEYELRWMRGAAYLRQLQWYEESARIEYNTSDRIERRD